MSFRSCVVILSHWLLYRPVHSIRPTSMISYESKRGGGSEKGEAERRDRESKRGRQSEHGGCGVYSNVCYLSRSTIYSVCHTKVEQQLQK